MRRQYLEQKARQPEAILFFRLGDFYETFDADAELTAAELGITLTSKPIGGGQRVPLAGVPVAHVEAHLARLVARGHRVAICEQLEDPRATKGLVRRGVVRVVSPGTALEPALLEAGEPSACAALTLLRDAAAAGQSAGARGWRLGLAALDLSTGACHALELRAAEPAELAAPLAAELLRLGVRELLLGPGLEEPRWAVVGAEVGPLPLRRAAVDGGDRRNGREARGAGEAKGAGGFRLDAARRALAARWGTPPGAADPGDSAGGPHDALRGSWSGAEAAGRRAAAALGLEERPAALSALGGALALVDAALPAAGASAGDGASSGAPSSERDGELGGELNGELGGGDRLAHLAPPRLLEPGARLQWDAAAQRALAIVEAPGGAGAPAGGRSGGRDGAPQTLLQVVDRCRSAAGRRWLRGALLAPLLARERIERRLERVAALGERPALRRAAREALREAPDAERLLARLVAGLARPAELAALARGLLAAAALGERLEAEAGEVDAIRRLAERLSPAPEAARALADALAEQPAGEFGGGVLRPGADAAVDAAAARRGAALERLAALERTLRDETSIAGLKLGYHRTWGYIIEVTRGQLDAVPEEWERMQSLRGLERFSEPRLRALAGEIECAEDELREVERERVEALAAELAAEAAWLRGCAGALARLDAAAGLADLAAERDWTRPQLDGGPALEIVGGRHPIVEAALGPAEFAPNDLALAADGVGAPQLLLLTGPNMSGKSTYLRQTALIVILAQAGCFVPAESARIGLVDRIFARVGAQDDLAAGRSTFLVEMLETARLLHGAGERSLVLLDEIGRGTSTWDGLAIAQAVAERLTAGRSGPRTLFATHFQELTALAGSVERIANAAVAAEEDGRGGLRFLHRVVPGAADRSWGVQVAAMAGLPRAVLERAAELLAALERGGSDAERLLQLPPPQPAFGAPGGAGARSAHTAPAPGATLLGELAGLDIDGLTPLEAISALYALREQARLELGPPAQLPLGALPPDGAASQPDGGWAAAGG